MDSGLADLFGEAAAWPRATWDWTTDTINAAIDGVVEAASVILTVLLFTAAGHFLPLLVIWLAGAPLWVVMALLLGFGP